MDRPPRLLSARVAALRVAPFVLAGFAAWIAAAIGTSPDKLEYWLSVVVALAAGAIGVLTVATRRWLWLSVVPCALLLLAAVGLLRNSVGGFASGVGALAILPVFQTALYSPSRRDLAIVLFGVALFYLVPIWTVGAPAYPPSQYRGALLALAVDGIIGFTTQRLVARVRFQVAEARSRERMLELVSEAVHRLFDSPQPRDEVCSAAMTISEAACAFLYEREEGHDRLVCTAAAGVSIAGHGVVVERRSAAYRALRSEQPVLITEDVEAHEGLIDLWIAGGRPSSMLHHPLLHHDQRLGVLVIGWRDDVRADGPRAAVVALLAREVAAVIARADALDQLSDQALTDPLTGLPNRRAWDRRVAEAADAGSLPTICLLDLDHFKRFNDTYGHPAGDRLLTRTAGAWRAQLRNEDFLARVGGEEFGVLLLQRDAVAATEIVQRLRANISDGWTCSAGIATQTEDEDAQATIARADTALYLAKANGRDRIELAAPALDALAQPAPMAD